MIADGSSYAATSPSANALQRADDRARARLALMRQLQASLCGSHKALQALDLAGIEQGTSEQVSLSRKLAEDLRSHGVAACGKRLWDGNQWLDDPAAGRVQCAPSLAEELRRSERGVWQALRLQLALLERAQCKLRVLANMLADPSRNYGPLPAQSGGPRRWPFLTSERERSDRCRA